MAADIDLKLGLELRGAISELKSFQNAIAKSTSDSAKRFNKLNVSLVNIASGLSIAKDVFNSVKFVVSDLVKEVSDAEETANKFNVVFGKTGKGASESVKNLADNFGLAKDEAQDLLAGTGDLLSGFGFGADITLDLSDQVQKLAVDLASFTNHAGGARGASEALTKALLGERESVKTLGIAILESDVKARVKQLEAMGRFTNESERQRKAIATLTIAQEQSKNAIGDFARSQSSFANQSKILSADLRDLRIELGNALLPTITAMTAGTIALVAEFNEMGGVESVISGVTEVFDSLPEIIAAATVGLLAFNAQLIVTTGTAIISGLTALVTGFGAIAASAALVAAPFIAVAAAITAVVAGTFFLVRAFRKSGDEIDSTKAGLQGVREELAFLTGNKKGNISLTSSFNSKPLSEEFKKFELSIVKSAASELKKVEMIKTEQLILLDEFRIKENISITRYNKLRLGITDAALDKEIALLNKANKDKEAEQKKNDDASKESATRIGSIASSVIGNISQGAEGVASAFSSVASTVVDTILPGFGAVAGQLVSFLAQGPEAVKAQIKAFVDNIPVIIQALVDSIPAVIDALVESVPELIESLVAQAPRIAFSIIKTLVVGLPTAAIRFADKLISRIPEIVAGFVDGLLEGAKDFIKAIVDGIKKFFGGVGSKVKKAGGKIVSGVKKIGKKLGFAQGGVVPGGNVPGGVPFIDRVPALLTPGESVLTRDTTAKLDKFLNMAAGSVSNQAQEVTINVQVGEAQLAQAIVNLTRQGFRLTA